MTQLSNEVRIGIAVLVAIFFLGLANIGLSISLSVKDSNTQHTCQCPQLPTDTYTFEDFSVEVEDDGTCSFPVWFINDATGEKRWIIDINMCTGNPYLGDFRPLTKEDMKYFNDHFMKKEQRVRPKTSI